MKQFEVGKIYDTTYGFCTIRVDRRTRCYAFYTVNPKSEYAFKGKARIIPDWNREFFLLRHTERTAFKTFCYSDKEETA